MDDHTPNTVVKKEILSIGNSQILLVRLSNPTVKSGDICKDNLGNIFTVKAAAHYKFTNEIPEWYLKTPEYQLEGKSFEIGQYLIILKHNN